MAQGKSKLKSKVQGKISKKNPTQRAGISKIKKGNKIIAPKKQTQQVGTPSAVKKFDQKFAKFFSIPKDLHRNIFNLSKDLLH